MYGDKCCYIHPSITCKYGIYCTRIGCAYSHPSGFNPGMGMYPNMMHPIPFNSKHKFKHGPTAAPTPGAKPEAVPQTAATEQENKNEGEIINQSEVAPTQQQ